MCGDGEVDIVSFAPPSSFPYTSSVNLHGILFYFLVVHQKHRARKDFIIEHKWRTIASRIARPPP